MSVLQACHSASLACFIHAEMMYVRLTSCSTICLEYMHLLLTFADHDNKPYGVVMHTAAVVLVSAVSNLCLVSFCCSQAEGPKYFGEKNPCRPWGM